VKHVRIDSVFDADSEYGIGFDMGCSFLDEKWVHNRQKSTKMVPLA
jgi:hypothetical protein